MDKLVISGLDYLTFDLLPVRSKMDHLVELFYTSNCFNIYPKYLVSADILSVL